ncbi:MAG TPA: MotA/TolQ/ExbB proton channel family protein [Candidatus Methylomirabilis sp.]|nr:MotA/TolQ/ExbB proton channel family protein [Candidatus Methylomirabilis sp.]
MSRMFRLLAGLLLAMSLSPVAWADEWAGQKKLVFDTVGSDVDLKEELSQVPVLIRLHAGNFEHFLDVKDDASDLRFFAADGKTPLPAQIEKFDALNEIALIWVQVPKLVPGKSDSIWMKYGNPRPGTAPDAKTVYDANTVAVYHFEAAAARTDATGNSNNVTTSTAEARPASIIGAGTGFSGTQKIVIPASPSLKFGESGFTFSAWVKIAAPQRDAALFARQDGADGVSLRLDQSKLYARVARGGKVQETARAGDLAPGTWHHVALTGGTRVVIYIDGRETAALDAATPALAGDIVLGASAGGGNFFSGELDEVELSNVARSAGWIGVAAHSQGPDAKFVTPGQDESGGGGGGTSYFGTILRAVTVDGWVVIAMLGIMAGVSWWVMINKFLTLRVMVQDNRKFVQAFQKLSRDPGALDEDDAGNGDKGRSDFDMALSGKHDHYQSSPIYRVYHVGIQELKHRFGQTDTRMLHGQSLTPQAIDAIRASLDAALVRENQKLNNLLVLLTIAISGGPFLGLLGTVVGVMITFAAIAATGDVNINAIAPGIAAALVATVAGLLVAIPALFGYNYIVTQIKNVAADMHVFIDEFISKVAEQYAADVRIAHEDAGRKRAV